MHSNLHYDQKLILKKISEGDTHAFTQLYNEWEPKMSSFIYSITKSKEITDEIVQDAFMKIWNGRNQLDSIIDFKAYFFTICKNQAINSMKKLLKEYKHLVSLGTSNFDIADEPFDEDKELALTLLEESLKKLPPRQKEVFIMHRFEKLTYEQIGLKLGIGRETVKTNLQIASKKISSLLLDKVIILSTIIDLCLD